MTFREYLEMIIIWSGLLNYFRNKKQIRRNNCLDRLFVLLKCFINCL